jgi:aspartyl/asparaginyl beta-hydroxylase (cupin superfamily)
MSRFSATIIQSGLCRTNAYPRPKPSLFYFPGLHSQPIYQSTDFKHSATLQANHPTILREYLHWRGLPNVRSDYEMKFNEHQLHSGSWEWNSYILKGKKQVEFAINCPETTYLLESIPSLMYSVPFSYAFFSTLHANTKIAPHFGPCNIRLRCHLPLIVPEGDCGLNVGKIS